MGMAVLLPLHPDIVRMAGRLICPPGTKMQIETYRYS
jgi:hypothetical protein